MISKQSYAKYIRIYSTRGKLDLPFRVVFLTLLIGSSKLECFCAHSANYGLAVLLGVRATGVLSKTQHEKNQLVVFG